MHLVPFWVEVLTDDFALEELAPDLDDPVRVWLAFDQPFHVRVLTQQVLSLDEVDPQDSLGGEKTTTVDTFFIKQIGCDRAYDGRLSWFKLVIKQDLKKMTFIDWYSGESCVCVCVCVLPWAWGSVVGPSQTLPPEGFWCCWAEPSDWRWCHEWCRHTNHWDRGKEEEKGVQL